MNSHLFSTNLLTVVTILLSNDFRAYSWVKIRATLFPTGSFVATSHKVVGVAHLLPGNKVEAKNITVPAGSFDSGIELRNKHIKQRFDVEKFPTITLLEARGQGGKGRGKLKVKDIVRDVVGTYKIVDGNMLHAEFKARASGFNIRDVSYLGVGMEDELNLEVEVPLKKVGDSSTSTSASRAGVKKKKK
jgi:hypothetical protein